MNNSGQEFCYDQSNHETRVPHDDSHRFGRHGVHFMATPSMTIIEISQPSALLTTRATKPTEENIDQRKDDTDWDKLHRGNSPSRTPIQRDISHGFLLLPKCANQSKSITISFPAASCVHARQRIKTRQSDRSASSSNTCADAQESGWCLMHGSRRKPMVLTWKI